MAKPTKVRFWTLNIPIPNGSPAVCACAPAVMEEHNTASAIATMNAETVFLIDSSLDGLRRTRLLSFLSLLAYHDHRAWVKGCAKVYIAFLSKTRDPPPAALSYGRSNATRTTYPIRSRP